MKKIHVAIMKKSWKLTEKIMTGDKTIESRWYQNKYQPWDRINPGDEIYFKNSGEGVKIKAEVEKVLQFDSLTPKKVWSILKTYGHQDGIGSNELEFKKYFEMFKNKKYCLLIFLKNVKKVRPFAINKTGFGAMSAWLTVNNIDSIKIDKMK